MSSALEFMSEFQVDEDFDVMTAAPLLWLEEFEQANPQRQNQHMWRDLHGRARLRGTSRLQGLDWPGQVHLPSPILDKVLAKKLIQLPKPWLKSVPQSLHGRLLSSLLAWELDRGIYRMTPISADLVSNCLVHVGLLPAMFEAMPSHALYVDLHQSHGFNDRIPLGFFASVDQSSSGQLDLVLVMDWSARLDVHVIPLQGKSIDEISWSILSDARAHAPASDEVTGDRSALGISESDVRETSHLWHFCVSALLMACINQQRMKILPEWVHDPFNASREAWTVWEIGHGIDEQIRSELLRHETGGRDPLLIGHWCKSDSKEAVRLQFAAGCQMTWSALERRHGVKGRNTLSIDKKNED